MAIKVYAPNRSYNGRLGEIQFRDGVAEVDEAKHAGAMAYMRRAGYGIGAKPVPPEPEPPQADARQPASVMVGAPLRDAAVDPKPRDFLPPLNAGKEDPHGPKVVAPEIHHPGPKGTRGGPVHVDEPKRQEEAEVALAEAILIDRQPHPAAKAEPAPPAEAETVELGEVPKPKAVKAAWVDWAVAHGAAREEAEGLSKAALIERYGGD
jgi:hypothetical protein